MNPVYPAPWWFRLLSKWFPERCREIPEATDPGRILLRQFAIIKKHVYLQQFASAENFEYFHTHPWKWGTIAIGLWGSVHEWRFGGVETTKNWYAPYFRYMGPNYIHNSAPMGPGHTSIFIGLGRKTDNKWYHRYQSPIPWGDHIQKKVRRI